eukprot:scaffold4536_cov164-Skeletonema_dohrnii-CCMP3373.AAC.6
MKTNTAYLNNKRVSDDDISLCTPPGNNSLVILDDTPSKSKRANTLKLQPRRSALVLARSACYGIIFTHVDSSRPGG